MARPFSLIAVLTAYGAAATVAQVAVLRALLDSFGGNQIAVSAGLFAWLSLTGLASGLSGKFADNSKRASWLVLAALLLLPAGTAAGFWLAGSCFSFFDTTPGEVFAPHTAILIAAFAISGSALPSGALYGWLVSAIKGSFGESLKRVTLWEALGAATGGLLFATIGISWLGTAGLIVCVFLLSITSACLWAFRMLDSGWRFGFFIGLVFSAATTFGLLVYGGDGQVSGYREIETKEGRFGRLRLMGREGQKAIFHGFQPVVDSEDWRSSEEVAIVSAGFRPDASEVLVLGGSSKELSLLAGLEGIRLVRVHPDEAFIHLEDKYFNFSNTKGNRFETLIDDPRRLLGDLPSGSLDLLVVLGSNLSTVAGSRYLSEEFLALAGLKLTDNKEGRPGLFLAAFGEPSNYISDPEADLLASLHLAGLSTFADCRILALDRYWLACSSEKIVGDIARISENFSKSGLKTRLDPSRWLSDAWSSSRREMIERALASGKQRGVLAHRDLSPLAPLHYLSWWAGRFDTKAFFLLAAIESALPISLLALLVLMAVLALVARSSARDRLAAGTSLAVFGASGIAVELSIMNAYQAGYGILYYRLGLLIAAYLVGLGLGARAAQARLDAGKTVTTRHITLLVLSAAVLLFVSASMMPMIAGQLPLLSGSLLAVALLFGYAFLAGVAYQWLAGRLRGGRSTGQGALAGLLREIDHMAAALMAIASGLLLIPLLGSQGLTVLCAVMLALCSLSWIRQS